MRSAYYKELKTTFYQSLEDENIALAENTGSKLLEMLHPDSLEKRIIKMDLACLGGGIK